MGFVTRTCFPDTRVSITHGNSSYVSLCRRLYKKECSARVMKSNRFSFMSFGVWTASSCRVWSAVWNDIVGASSGLDEHHIKNNEHNLVFSEVPWHPHDVLRRLLVILLDSCLNQRVGLFVVDNVFWLELILSLFASIDFVPSSMPSSVDCGSDMHTSTDKLCVACDSPAISISAVSSSSSLDDSVGLKVPKSLLILNVTCEMGARKPRCSFSCGSLTMGDSGMEKFCELMSELTSEPRSAFFVVWRGFSFECWQPMARESTYDCAWRNHGTFVAQMVDEVCYQFLRLIVAYMF